MTPPGARKAASDADCRCVCGSLVARLVDGGVELKCRRCKRTVLVPLEDARSEAPTWLPVQEAQ